MRTGAAGAAGLTAGVCRERTAHHAPGRTLVSLEDVVRLIEEAA